MKFSGSLKPTGASLTGFCGNCGTSPYEYITSYPDFISQPWRKAGAFLPAFLHGCEIKSGPAFLHSCEIKSGWRPGYEVNEYVHSHAPSTVTAQIP